jgi:hypothetical protein
VYGYLVADVASFEREVGRYAGTSACEKVPLAEYLVEFMASDEKCDAAGYEWKAGTDDWSLPAGRSKWALESRRGRRRGRVAVGVASAVGVGSLKFDFSLTSSTGTGRMPLWLGR